MNDQQRVYDLVVLMANKETSPDDRKLYYENALHIVRNPTAKPKRIKPTTFLEFWAAYPLKVAKEPAEKAYIKALTITDHATIMKGLRYYCLNKEEFAAFAHAATWLNARRWEDGQADLEKQVVPVDTIGWPEWKHKIAKVFNVVIVNTWFNDADYMESWDMPSCALTTITVPKASYQWIKDRYFIELNKIFTGFSLEMK